MNTNKTLVLGLNYNLVFQSLAVVCLVFLALGWHTLVPWPTLMIGAIIIFLAVKNQAFEQYAVWFAVFAASTSFLWPAKNLQSSLEQFFLACICLLAVVVAMHRLNNYSQQSGGVWFAPLFLFLIQPTTLGLLGGFGLMFLTSLNNKNKRHKNLQLSQGAIFVLSLSLFFLAAISFWLPQPSWQNFMNPNAVGKKVLEHVPTEPKTSTSKEVGTNQNELVFKSQPFVDLNQVELGMQLLMLTISLLLIVVVVQLRKIRQTRPLDWWSLIPLVGMGILQISLLAYSLLSSSGSTNISQALQSGKAATAKATKININKINSDKQLLNLSWVNIVLIVVALLMLIYALWLLRQPLPNPETKTTTDVSDTNDTPNTEASNRVREIYKNFLMHMESIGFTRSDAETAQQFIRRISPELMSAQNNLQTLTNIYEPVRYGQYASEAGALKAEQAFTEILRATTQVLNNGVKS